VVQSGGIARADLANGTAARWSADGTHVTATDLDGDGLDEGLVGTEDGFLRAYSEDLALLLEWSAGDLNAGDNGALFAAPTADGTLVVFAVTGGFRVLRIAW
jgi:hypothetical protein